jgi:hypothetical protein
VKELFIEDQRYTEEISFPLERKRVIENFTKSIRYSFFYILLIDESYMGSPSAPEKPIEDFNLSKRLLKRQQEVFSQDLRDSKFYSLMNRIVDLWKIKNILKLKILPRIVLFHQISDLLFLKIPVICTDPDL